MNAETIESRLVDARVLLEVLFDERSRPSLRWLREMQKRGVIPHTKLGHLVFYDVGHVREALAERHTRHRRRSAAREIKPALES